MREVVQQFVKEMDKIFQKYDDRGEQQWESIEDLNLKIGQKANRLSNQIYHGKKESIIQDAIDLARYSLVIADNVKRATEYGLYKGDHLIYATINPASAFDKAKNVYITHGTVCSVKEIEG